MSHTDIDTINELDVIDQDDIPNPRDIMAGLVTSISNRDISVCYVIMNALCFELKYRAEELNIPNTSDEAREIFAGEVDTVICFMRDNFSPELTVLGIKLLLTSNYMKFPVSSMPNFKKLVDDFSDLLLD